VVVMLWMEGCIVLYCIVCNCNVTEGGWDSIGLSVIAMLRWEDRIT
jgi:hypothetical protein